MTPKNTPSCTKLFTPHQGIYDHTYLIDPTDAEETLCSTKSSPGTSYDHGILVQAVLSQHSQVTEIFMAGSVDVDTIAHSMDLLNEAHKDICNLLEQCLVKTVYKASHSSIKRKDKK